MEAHVEGAHHHHHHDDVEVNPAAWRDGKRYAWLLGILVPLAPFRKVMVIDPALVTETWKWVAASQDYPESKMDPASVIDTSLLK